MAGEYTTAFAEALSSSDPNTKLPSYITAADTLNQANGNGTFLDSAFDTVGSIPKFVAVSLISGANQLYNIPSDIGNAMGMDLQTSQTQDIINSLDSDLGQFYKDNKQSADLAGFLVSSAVPGMAGVKLLKVGQASLNGAIGAGKFGSGMGQALGLLAPQKQKLLGQAVKAVSNNSAVPTLAHRNAVKTIAAGFGQNAYEALAFEVAVSLTMFNSPTLENQTFGDFMSNVLWGAGAFGVIGGALDATKLNYALKGAADKAAVEARPWQHTEAAHVASDPYEALAMNYEQLNKMPPIPEGLDPSRAQFLETAAGKTKAKLEGEIKTNLRDIAGGDQVMGAAMYDSLRLADHNSRLSTIIGLKEATRLADSGKLAAREESLFKKVMDAKATEDEVLEYGKSTVNVAYMRTWGENIGQVITSPPKVVDLVDTLRARDKFSVTPKGVQAGRKNYTFDTKYNTRAQTTNKVTKRLRPAGEPWKVTAKTDLMEAQARYIWAGQLPKLAPSATKPLTVYVDDLPMMEKVLAEVTDPEVLKHIQFTGADDIAGIDNLLDFVGDTKLKLAHKLLAEGKHTQEEIASMLNVKSSFLSGETVSSAASKYAASDILAMQSHAEAYTKLLVDRGVRKESQGLVNIWEIPRTAKLTYEQATEGKTPLAGINTFVAENMRTIKAQQGLYQEGLDRAVAEALGEDFDKLIPISSQDVRQGALTTGAGAKLLTAASGDYGTLASTVEYIGSVTSSVIEKGKAATRGNLEPFLYKLGKDPAAAIEWSTLNARVRGIEGEYALNSTGDALEPLLITRWKQAVASAAEEGLPPPKPPVLPNPDMELSIPLQSQAVRDLAKAHIEVNSARTSKLAGIRTAQGTQFNRSPEAFYPIPVDPKDYPYFAIVSDESITSGNHTKTLYASSETELQGMIDKLATNPQLKVRTKAEAEQFYKDEGIWDYEKTLNENYLDVAAHRKGVSAPYFVPTDSGKIVNDMLNWHLQRESGLARELVSAKYEIPFEELRRLGEQYTNVATSKFSKSSVEDLAEGAANNPFADYFKTALAIKKDSNYPWWVATNRMADQKFSQMFRKVDEISDRAKSTEDLAEINGLLKQAGYKGAAYDESMEIFANAEPAKGALSATVQKANSLLATVVLRWDALNAATNAISANVLLGAETKSLVNLINSGGEGAVAEFNALAKINLPGTDKLTMSAPKMIAKAMAKFNNFDSAKVPDFEFFKEHGFVTSISAQYRDAVDAMTFTGKEGVGQWSKRMDDWHAKAKQAGDLGEKYTGNKLAEEFNRFVAADVMKQMTDVAVARNLMSPKEQLSYINTFVNRTQGNYLASQRPGMFQGPLGQAIGLFQTYQFNLMQQLLRHVGEGRGKDAMTLLALQGTIHGMNGLPAFSAINTHLVGTASGNAEHRDFYTETYRAAGKEAGDFLMYGMASNVTGLLHPDLKVNLYTRGDINPRHLTIIPTSPADVPIVAAYSKFFGNLFGTAEKLSAGGDISATLLQGIEHNGLSRPLAGLAQTLQGVNNVEQASYSTTKNGNVVGANDLLSLTSVPRLLGGKPMDEAITMDALFRYKTYAAADSKKRNVLGAAIKSKMLGGGELDQEDIETFAGRYAEAGGRQEEFNKWFTQLYKGASLSQANKIKDSLNSPYSKSMQLLMGGESIKDFSQPTSNPFISSDESSSPNQ